ncbi:hypothetical protein M877_34555 [Streptomyces niveus NCIMB 11891]|nr:hypothetical protein M877_34555 [Streptomyces niveus NCIMB 11891]
MPHCVTAAVRSVTPSLAKMRSRWVFTVDSPMNRWRPISAFVHPSATSRSTAVSRRESLGRSGRLRSWSTRRAATEGARTVSPRGIRRSIRTMSGPSSALNASAWGPLDASPTTVRSGSALSMPRSPSRTTG